MISLARDRVRAFVRLGRPRFLLGGVVLYGVGAAMAVAGGRAFDARAYLLGQCAITSTQLMTHYANDYFDVEADAANRRPTPWSGGSRVLADGELSPRVARNAALAFGALAATIDAAIAVSHTAARDAAAMLIGALALSWAYNAPPLRLHPRGLGPLTAAIVVGGLTPLVGVRMQRAPLHSDVLVSVAPLVVAQFALIVVLDLPDAEGDAAARKRTLAVRLGERVAARLAFALVVATYALVVALAAVGLPRITAFALVATAPVGAALLHALAKESWRSASEAGALTFRAVAWFAALALTSLAGALFAAS